MRAVSDAGLRGRGGAGYPTGASGAPCVRSPPRCATSWPTASRPIPAPRWTARSWRPTRTPSSRAWPSPRSPSARRRRSSSCAPMRPPPSSGSGGARGGRGGRVRGRRRRSAAASRWRSRSGRWRAPSWWARRPSCCGPWRASGAQPDQRPPYPSERGLWGPDRRQQRGDAGERALDRRQRPGRVPGDRRPGVPGHRPRAAQRRGPPARRREVPTGTPIAVVVDGPAAARPGSSRRSSSAARRAASCPPTAWTRRSRPRRSRRPGPILGSGTVLVLDEHACLVDLATLMTRYLNDEACGKTIPCRIGTRRLAELGERF